MSPPLKPTAHSDHLESSDCYRGELFRADGYRVITCGSEIQWTIQRRTRAGSPAGPRWDAVGYYLTRDALARDWTGLTGTHASAQPQPPHFTPTNEKAEHAAY